MEWFRKAAEKGYVGAQFSVVSMNEHGKGVDQNYSTKMELYRKTAEQGHTEAKERLHIAVFEY